MTALGKLQSDARHQAMQVFCRISYYLATPALAALARQEHIYKEQKFSDHAPVAVECDWAF